MDLNRQVILGNVGSSPEMRFFPDGTPSTTFRVAVNKTYKNRNGETQKETEWFQVVTFKRQAETCNEFLHSGMRVYVEGETKTRSWEGQDGQKKYRTEVRAQRVIFLDKRSGEQREVVDDEVDAEALPFE